MGGRCALYSLIEFVPEGGPFGVEYQGQVLGLPLPEHLEEHGGHPVGGVGGHSPGVGQGRQGVKGPVKIGADVDEVEDAGEGFHHGYPFPPYSHYHLPCQLEKDTWGG